MNPAVDWSQLLTEPGVASLLRCAMQEDVGTGDITTAAIFGTPEHVKARISTRTPTVVCGLPLARSIFRGFDADIQWHPYHAEGAVVVEGALVEIRGNLQAILTAERCALNFLMRLCGIAQAAHTAQGRVPEGLNTRVLDTRKTTPGWRQLEKAAVRTGGAYNHRMGLYDGILIKDNHVARAGSITQAVAAARSYLQAHHLSGVEVELEIDSLEQLPEALDAQPDIILLDNFSDQDMRCAVEHGSARHPKIEFEASGGITLERIAEIARCGVDRISMGALTHTVVPADLTLEILSA